MVRTVDKWLARCELVLLTLAIVCAVSMMCLTSADAILRYLFNKPIEGAYELTEKYFMVGTVFLGVSYAYRGGALIRITFLVERLPEWARLIANYFAQIVSVSYCILLVVATFQQSLRVQANGTALSTLDVPLGPANFLVPIGLFFLSALTLIDVLRVKSGESHLFQESTSAS